MHTRFGVPTVAADSAFRLTDWQEDGAARAQAVLARYGGVVIADSVGMGKTFIGLRLLERMQAGDDTIVVVPAPLRSKWRAALRPLAGVTVVSHTALSRVRPASMRHALVLVDEAHQFRNPATARYRALSRLCAGASVILLTATPINNRLGDLYWLLRLFLGDGALRRSGVADLKSALLTGERPAPASAASVVAQVVVRRTRADIPRAAAAQVGHFPRRMRPTPVHYDLTGRYPNFEELLELITRQIAFAAFNPVDERANRAPRGPVELIRLAMLKRLESSTWALRRTAERVLASFRAAVDAAMAGGWVRPADLVRRDDRQLTLAALVMRPLPQLIDRARLIADLSADVQRLEQLLRCLPEGPDPKCDRLDALLHGVGASPRVVFTQYRDTAEYLHRRLPQHCVALLSGSRALIGTSSTSRKVVLERFAPHANGRRTPPPHERVLTLIATDVLSEGLDLQDAQHCISYDLPWNPVRLMQRVGRIDRMHSRHARVYSWYFTPGDELEPLLQLTARLRRKVRTIEATVGREAPVLSGTCRRSDARARTGSDRAHGRARQRAREPALARLAAVARETAAPPIERPAGATMRHPVASPDCVVVLALESAGHGWWEGYRLPDEGGARAMSERAIARTMVTLRDALGAFDESAHRTDEAARILADALARCRRARGNAPAAPGRAPRAAIRTLTAALRVAPGGLDARLCRRTERLLRRLHSGLPAGSEIALEDILARHVQTGPSDAARLVAKLEMVVTDRAPRAPVRLAAILVVFRPSAG